MADWFRTLVPVCHADLTGHRNPIADLGSGVPGNPGAALEARVASKSSSSLPVLR
jgi:hypothetical protein